MKISEKIYSELDYITSIRRELHACPELSFFEFKTHDIIIRELEKFGADSITTVKDTGVVAVFSTDNSSPAIAFRADIDALPINEETLLPYASKHAGVMHACGHDGHVSILLALAKLISQNRSKLNRDVVLIFEPGEEDLGGAKDIISQGALKNVSEIYGLHIWPYLTAGKIGINEGALMAHMIDFDVNITGKSAHGGNRSDGIDALLAAAKFTDRTNSLLLPENTTLNIGKITSGENRNVVAKNAHIEGTLRSLLTKNALDIKEQLINILKDLESEMGVKTELTEIICYPAVVNPKELCDKAREILKSTAILPEPVMMAEDFSWYQQSVPGLFAFLGVKDELHTAPLHSSLFNFDEKWLSYGLQFFARIAGIDE